MSRKIRFKARTIEYERYVTGFYLERELEDGFHSYIFDGTYEHEVEPRTVEQFTGFILEGVEQYSPVVRFGMESVIEKAYCMPMKEILRDMYTDKGMTLKEISELLGISIPTTSKWLKKYKLSKKRPSWDKGLTIEQRKKVRELLESTCHKKEGGV